MAEKDVWFEYVSVPGRFSAVPVSWKGWLALILLIAAPTAAMLLWGAPLLRQHKLWIGPAVVLELAIVFGITLPLVIAKGRRRA